MAGSSKHLIVHFVGSIPLPDAETVFRTLADVAAPYLLRLPDGETGIRKTWIRFLQDVLAENPAIERAMEVPPFKFTQWDGKVLREIPRLRVKRGATPDPDTFKTGYAEMALASWSPVRTLGKRGRHSGASEIPSLAPDADRAYLQQHAAVRPACAVACAYRALDGRG
jgi:hypothetical protein